MAASAALAALVLAGAAALAAATAFRLRARLARIARTWPPEGVLLDAGGTRIHAVIRGTGPDLVLIHGLSGSARDFTFRLVDALAPSFRVIAFDRPGLGHSDPVPQGRTLAAQAAALRLAAAALGARRPLVLGFSYGGAVALRWALDAPADLRGLVLVAPVSHPWTTGLTAYYHLTSTPVLRWLTVPLLAAWAPRSAVARATAGVFAPDPVPQGYIAHFGPETALRPRALLVNGAQRRALRAEIAAQAPRYPAIACPVEIVHGTADATVGLAIHAARLLADIPGAALDRLPGTGHMAHHARQDAVLAAVRRAAARAA
ncbi:MAG: alpha/beta hydrolase [Rhodobacteraceae bacterium]|nr:alpha/beta hydrolase [Paracoccaceae bacterium]